MPRRGSGISYRQQVIRRRLHAQRRFPRQMSSSGGLTNAACCANKHQAAPSLPGSLVSLASDNRQCHSQTARTKASDGQRVPRAGWRGCGGLNLPVVARDQSTWSIGLETPKFGISSTLKLAAMMNGRRVQVLRRPESQRPVMSGRVRPSRIEGIQRGRARVARTLHR
jgi:hypothetical protein